MKRVIFLELPTNHKCKIGDIIHKTGGEIWIVGTNLKGKLCIVIMGLAQYF